MSEQDEAGRIAALRALRVLDTPAEAIFDSLTQLAALTFQTPVALVSLVDSDRQWFKSCVGLDVDQTHRDVAFCDHAIRQDRAFIVEDATRDDRFKDNPLVTGPPGIRFYAGAPLITPQGHHLGTLCVIDFEPRAAFDASERAQLEAMARAVTEAMFLRRDISDYMALEREQAKKHELVEQAEEMAGVGHWSWNSLTDETVWSPAVYEIHGLDPSNPSPDLKGALEFYQPEDATKLAGLIERAVSRGEPYALQAQIRRLDGEVRHVAARGACARGDDGAVESLFGTFIDITDYVQLQERLKAARDAAEDAAAVKSNFIANMSHEIRTPLTAILGFSNFLSERPDLDSEARHHVECIAAAGQALLGVVNDVLDFSRLEAGQVEISPERVSPDALLREAVMLLSGQAAAKGLELTVGADLNLPACVMVDPQKVRQIILNLLGNAVKFTDRGAVRLSAAYDESAARLEISVEDTGGGLSQDQQVRLFQRFSQVDDSSTRRHGGAGLGLAISKQLAEAMGGGIGVSSTPGRGSTFRFHVAAPLAQPRPAEVAPSDAPRLDYVRVLVVDDNETNRELARAMLEWLGAEVVDADDGVKGLEAAVTQPFDVVLLDLLMPEMDGRAVLSAIRSVRGPNQDVPVLAFTAEGDPADSGVGFDGVVSKPFAPARIATTILTALGDGPDEPVSIGGDACAAA